MALKLFVVFEPNALLPEHLALAIAVLYRRLARRARTSDTFSTACSYTPPLKVILVHWPPQNAYDRTV